jgi:hypothetical protein
MQPRSDTTPTQTTAPPDGAGAPPALNTSQPYESAVAQDDASARNGGEGPNLGRPYTDWARKSSDAAQRLQDTMNNSPIAAKGVSGRFGDVVNVLGAAFGVGPVGNYIKYRSQVDASGVRHPSMGQYQSDVARAKEEADLADSQATLQGNLENQRQQRRIQDLNNRRTNYDRRLKDIESAGGYELPPGATSSPAPGVTKTDPNNPPADVPWSMPMSPLLSSPNLQPQGNVESLVDPDTGRTRTMLRPTGWQNPRRQW